MLCGTYLKRKKNEININSKLHTFKLKLAVFLGEDIW
jgi:hypothetical protein